MNLHWLSRLSASLSVTVVAALAQSEAPPSATMNAVRLHEFGGSEKLVYEKAPKPAPKPGELLIEVFAAGVNPVDWKIRTGRGKAAPSEPMILGYDVSGVVTAVGEGVERFKPGDEVFAYLSLQRGGGYAEYAIALESEVAKKPTNVDHVQAAAIPLAALTAYQALFETAELKEGQSVLIHAGAGGVGHFAIQLAKTRGVKVFATASEKNLSFLKSLGADVAIDYEAQRFEQLAKDVDVVLVSIPGETLERSYATTKQGGMLVSIIGGLDEKKLAAQGVRGRSILVRPDGKQLTELAQLVEDHKLVPTVSLIVPLAEAAKAHDASQTSRTRGKIVLKVR
jgi:NADPH:quinone reductase-like Zn-dependent oxidoreductase